MYYFSTCSQRCGSSLKRKDSSTTPEEAERGPEGRQRCSLTLFMLITSIYCAHNMGAAPSSELPVPCSISTSKSSSSSWPCYCSFYIHHALLSSFSCSSGLRATHASLDTLPAAGCSGAPHPPPLATHFFSLDIFFVGPIPILRQGKFNYRMRIFLRSPLFFFVLFVSAWDGFLFQAKASQDELSAYQHLFAVDLCSEHTLPPTGLPRSPGRTPTISSRATRSVKQSTSTSTIHPALLNICQVC